ncbi:PQQ-binding-like beta-propeller repeat protein [Patescibacteria group bacterium]|nr:PQQ-binding-like beta-propeller repeat protein [Patescibacteria group bacterium]
MKSDIKLLIYIIKYMWGNNKKYIIGVILVVILVVIISVLTEKNTISQPHTTYYTNNVSSAYGSKKNNSVVTKTKTHLSKVVLKKNYGLPFFSQPVVSGNYSFLDTANYFETYGVSNPKYKGATVKIDNKTGKIVWRTDFPNLVMNNPLVISQLGMVIVSTGNDAFFKTSKTTFNRGTGLSGVYALNINTGKIIWKFTITNGQRKPTPTYKNGVVYTIGGNRMLYALNVNTGKMLWSLDYGSISSQAAPLLVGNNLYFGGSYPYYLFDVNIQTHKIVWKHNFKKTGVNKGLDDVIPAYSNGYIYTDAAKLVNDKTNSGYEYLYKINAHTGSIVWSLKEGYGPLNLPHGAQMIGSVPTISGNMVYVGSTATQRIIAVNTNTGKVVWSTHSVGLNNKPFIVVGNYLYYDNGLGNIQVYNKNTGEYLATRTTGGKVAVGGIFYANGRFYADNLSGDFYIFK